MTKQMVRFQFWIALVVFIGISVFFYFNNPAEFLDTIGVHNTYLFVFGSALLAGLMFLTSAFFYATIVGLALSGFSPIVLAIVGGLGLFLGDSFVYFLGKKGRDSMNLSKHPKILKFSQWLVEQPYPLVILLILLYGLTPFPNEILVLALSVLGYSYRKVWYALLAGNVLLVFTLGYLALLGIDIM